MPNYYDESIYDREVFERIKKITENNENFKNLNEAEIAHKVGQMKDSEKK
jgi:molybdopterin synthase catalytic subunit